MRPRVLVMPTISRLEWPIAPLLEEWADVAWAEGPWSEDGQAARTAVSALQKRDWDDAVVVVDEWAIWKAIELATERPGLIRALAIGHAALSLSVEGDRPTMNPSVVEGYTQLMKTDFRTYARALTQTTRGDFDEALVDSFLEKTSHQEVLDVFDRTFARMGESFEPTLRALDVPMLFGHHTACLLWTEEGFRDAVAAFPDAATVRTENKCSASPDWAAALRKFCESL